MHLLGRVESPQNSDEKETRMDTGFEAAERPHHQRHHDGWKLRRRRGRLLEPRGQTAPLGILPDRSGRPHGRRIRGVVDTVSKSAQR